MSVEEGVKVLEEGKAMLDGQGNPEPVPVPRLFPLRPKHLGQVWGWRDERCSLGAGDFFGLSLACTLFSLGTHLVD
jgi:hypothetical protein